MTPSQWALLYLAVGAAYAALRWHQNEHKILAETERQREVLHPVVFAIAVALATSLTVLVWPVQMIRHSLRTPS